jgi:hypothetical protein
MGGGGGLDIEGRWIKSRKLRSAMGEESIPRTEAGNE